MNNLTKNYFYLSGIVPVAGEDRGFNFPWLDCMLPIAPSFLAVQSAVCECAYAGCDTIWVVGRANQIPLLRRVLGEYIEDPVYLDRRGKNPYLKRRMIPIYFVPLNNRDIDRRDCIGWSVLYGCLSSYWVSKKISKWLLPDKYYISFPYGILPYKEVRQSRGMIQKKENFFFVHENKNIKDGLSLSFTMDFESYKTCRDNFKSKATNQYIKNTNERLSLEERYSGRFFSLDKFFEPVKMTQNTASLSSFYDISTWDKYKEYISSDFEIQKPNFYKFGKLSRIIFKEEKNEPGEKI